MNKVKTFFIFDFIVLIGILIISCNTDGESIDYPWDGQEVHQLFRGNMTIARSGVSNGKAGEKYWYYIDALEGMNYTISMFSVNLPNWMRYDPNLASTWANVIMTDYKEDGIIFGRMNPSDEGNGINTPIKYYSPYDQRLLICYEFRTTGYMTFRYAESWD